MQNNEKTIKDLNLQDDFLFAKIMTDKEICRKVLEKILNISIKEVILPDAQHTIDILYEGKGILFSSVLLIPSRLDVIYIHLRIHVVKILLLHSETKP